MIESAPNPSTDEPVYQPMAGPAQRELSIVSVTLSAEGGLSLVTRISAEGGLCAPPWTL